MAAISEQTRAALLAALLEGQSVSAVARQFSVARSTVIRYRDLAGIQAAPVEHEKIQRIGDLVFDYLTEVLTTLAAQQRAFREERWLKRQDAAGIATLHGVSADKAFRLLAALESVRTAGESGDAADPGPLAP